MEKVIIRRQWNDWRKYEIYLEKIGNLHWDRISGGVHALSPKPFIYGYVWCNDIDEIPHSCVHGSAPHRIKVVLVKKDNSKEIWDKIVGIAGSKP